VAAWLLAHLLRRKTGAHHGAGRSGAAGDGRGACPHGLARHRILHRVQETGETPSKRSLDAALIHGSEPSAHRGRTEWFEPLLPFSGNERVLPCQEQLEEWKIIVSPEELVSHLHGRDTEDSTGNRLVGPLTKAILDLRRLCLCDQDRSRQAHFVYHVLDDCRVAEMESPNPGGPEERVDQIVALRIFERK